MSEEENSEENGEDKKDKKINKVENDIRTGVPEETTENDNTFNSMIPKNGEEDANRLNLVSDSESNK